MNSLSWFIYLADTLPRLSSAAGFVFGMMTLILFCWLIFCIVCKAVDEDKVIFPPTWWLIGCLLITLSTTLIPRKETLYLIAGSEAGEMVIKDENTQAIVKDVREVIQLQLERLKAPTASN